MFDFNLQSFAHIRIWISFLITILRKGTIVVGYFWVKKSSIEFLLYKFSNNYFNGLPYGKAVAPPTSMLLADKAWDLTSHARAFGEKNK